MKQFLNREWIEVVAGRAAILRLDGPLGSLDLVTVYMHTGQASDSRAEVRDAIARALRPPSRALTILIGDWNFVRESRDRMNLEAGNWAGQQDESEHDVFEAELFEPNSVHEVRQMEMTHRNAQGTSRLDRAYVNAHVADQLSRAWVCTALDWVPRLSAHRPIEVARRSPPSGSGRPRAVPLGPSRREDWPRLVTLRWGELRQADTLPDTAHRRLLLLKRAMATVSFDLNRGAPAEAETASEKLGCAIRCLRAVEEYRPAGVHRAAREFPALRAAADLEAALAGDSDATRALRDFVVHLAREDVRHELHELSNARHNEADDETSSRRESIAAKIRKLKPGASTSLRALRAEDGSVITTPRALAAELSRHWGNVFTAKNINGEALDRWLQEFATTGAPQLAGQPAAWHVQKEDVQRALQRSRPTAPGPDGISSVLWKRLGPLAVDVLSDAAHALARETATEDIRTAYADEDTGGDQEGGHAFNLGVLCCIPKRPVECHQEFGDVYTAEGTRPLSLVDVSNRILAGAYKEHWEGILGGWVSKDQRGFLPVRSMIANVVDLEHHALHVAATCPRGMIMLFGFKAASPSASHQFLRRCLRGFGMPEAALRVLDALYDNARCEVSVGGGRFQGFTVGSGIRQGCPLSPLIFATAMDLLLRVLNKRLGAGVAIRAFADDVGVVLSDVDSQLPILQRALEEFGSLSGMEVNLPKAVGVPLWSGSLEAAAGVVAGACPAWQALPLKRSATYLGCKIGPGKTDDQWDNAMRGFRERIDSWPWTAMGLHFASLAYNVYALPVLAFTCQVAEPSRAVLDLEQWALRRVAPGPGQWATPEDLWRLEDFGMPCSFGSLRDLARAAQLRVYHFENRAHGGLQLAELAQQLYWGAANHGMSVEEWVPWREASVPMVLNKTVAKLAILQVTSRSITSHAHSEPWRNFQKAARKRIRQAEATPVHFRIRHKLARWSLPGLPRAVADTFESRLRRLRELVPPRVVAAVFGTGWNRWCTARRFQQRASVRNVCRLGCGGAAEDSVEHYSRCAAVRRFHGASLRLRTTGCYRCGWECTTGRGTMTSSSGARWGHMPHTAPRTPLVRRAP